MNRTETRTMTSKLLAGRTAGIRANAITPGLIVTDFSRTNTPEDVLHSAAGSWPLGRAGSASEIAGACLFLASDLSSYVTGSTLDVNGGAYMR